MPATDLGSDVLSRSGKLRRSLTTPLLALYGLCYLSALVIMY